MRITFSNTAFDLTQLDYGVADTPLGAVFVGYADDTLYFIGLVPTGQTLDEAMARRRRYFSNDTHFVRNDTGARPFIDLVIAEWNGQNTALQLALYGTPFQQEVWQALTKIPKGQAWTYKNVAVHIGRPNAVRAVGTANGNNPMSILVPCHRVVPMSGGVGGYGWGCDVKARLLAAEASQE